MRDSLSLILRVCDSFTRVTDCHSFLVQWPGYSDFMVLFPRPGYITRHTLSVMKSGIQQLVELENTKVSSLNCLPKFSSFFFPHSLLFSVFPRNSSNSHCELTEFSNPEVSSLVVNTSSKGLAPNLRVNYVDQDSLSGVGCSKMYTIVQTHIG